MLRLDALVLLASMLCLDQASARLLQDVPGTTKEEGPWSRESVTGTLEIVEVTCARGRAYDEVAVEPSEKYDQDAVLGPGESDFQDALATSASSEIVFTGQSLMPSEEANHTRVEYYLKIANNATGAFVTQKRLYFKPGHAPSSDVTTGWTIIIIQWRPAAEPQPDACSNETFVPNVNASGDFDSASAVVVDTWAPIGGPLTSQAAWPPSTGGAWNVTSVTYILNLCGNPLTISQTMVQASWFSNSTSSATPSLQQNWGQCSYGQYSFTSSNNIVVGPIYVPCRGVRADGITPFSTATCGGNDRYGWAEYAENYTTKVLGRNLAAYRHGIFIVNNPACTFTGMANVGCHDYCRSWITSGGPTNVPAVNAVFHELGHNYFLNHAMGSDNSEYGDITSSMGGCCATRCFNTPQHMQLGWSKPIPNGVISNTNLPEATWRTFTVPSQSMTNQSTNYMQILTQSWLSTPLATGATYYVGYKSAYGYDRFLSSTLLRKVNVYTWDGVSQTSFVKTQIRAQLAAGAVYTDTVTRLRIRARSTGLSQSTVSICRWRATSTATQDCP